jgi:glycerophosphoryl diester phosphodiesterase
MPPAKFAEIYRDPEHVALTAHRGFSGKYPENTLSAFQAAIDQGVEILEMDIHPTSDMVPVVVHDHTVDRTTDGTGEVTSLSLAKIKELNASWWEGSQVEDGFRRESPAEQNSTIPTFAEYLDAFAGRVGMNIQVKSPPPAEMLAEICRLFKHHNLYETAYLSMGRYDEGSAVRVIDPKIPLCILEEQNRMDEASLRRQHHFGVACIQPMRKDVTPENCAIARSLGLPTNVFWSNDAQTTEQYVTAGVQGIVTDWPDRVDSALVKLGRR